MAKLFFVISIVFICNYSTAMAHECDVILEQGIRNTFQELRTNDFRQAFSSAYCNKVHTSKSSSSGGSAGGSYGLYSLDFSSNSKDSKSSRIENCGDSAALVSEASYLKAMQLVADKNIVDAWSSCRNSAYGVMITGEINGDDLIVTYVFRSAGAVSHAVVDGDPEIRNATCNAAVKDKTVINTGGRIQYCTRKNDGPITIAINTNFQPARFFVPAVEKKASLPEKTVDNIPQRLPGCNKRELPGVGVAPPGYTWCILDKKFNNPPNVQGYCFAKEESGRCHCATVPPGYPQPSRESYGVVYECN